MHNSLTGRQRGASLDGGEFFRMLQQDPTSNGLAFAATDAAEPVISKAKFSEFAGTRVNSQRREFKRSLMDLRRSEDALLSVDINVWLERLVHAAGQIWPTSGAFSPVVLRGKTAPNP